MQPSTLARSASSIVCGVLLTQLAACGGGGGGSGASPFVAAAATTGATGAAAQPQASDPIASTPLGFVTGVDQSKTSGTHAWLGIPYAKPPVGALRWMPPVAAEPWAGPRSARQFGPSCAQGGRFFSPAPNDAPYSLAVRDGFGKPVGSEDCLTLNIWRPSNEQKKLPVIVFIHGGSNISGYSADPIYDGKALAAKANAVVVTINYRLGLYGWLDMPQLKTGNATADSGNFGTLDQIQALKYVNANIESFGGDAGNVTVMGQSAGSVNVWALMVSPLTAGLMHKAVSLSGGLVTTAPAQAKLYANSLLSNLVIADGKATDALSAQLYIASQTPEQIATYVRGKSSDDVIKASLAPGMAAAPAVISDGSVIPAVPAAAIAAGNYRKVPMLAGNTNEEGKLFGGAVGAYKPNDYDRFTMQYNFNPDAAPTLTEADLLNPTFLPVDKPVLGWNTVAAALSTSVFLVPGNASLAALATQQSDKIWYFRFDWKQEPKPFDTVYGAVHAIDLPFFFNTFDRKSVFSFAFNAANRPGREALSDAMMSSLAAFVRNGNPNNPTLNANWPLWPARMVFDASNTQANIGVR
ncbi:carboxylesterase/lipase family protein [Variovorax sp. KK3]|uniref:carboxylesterase/lipase family protein n=1 Tax=Variovorax sp. KK3 TaxID=1855728 RepID=UPI00097C5AAE|nr:carboxylesterase family protein [Variovorax sp. KK3]